MKNILFNTLALLGLVLFLIPTSSAQDGVKYDNPQWKRVVMLDFHAHKKNRAIEIIDTYFKPASEDAGTPGPEVMVDFKTGAWDRMAIWGMDGIESMNWSVSPENQKWWAALAKRAGGEKEATALYAEYQACIARSSSELALME